MEMLEYDLYSSCRGTISLYGLYNVFALGNSRLSNSLNHQSSQYSQSQANLQQSQPSSFPKQKASSAGFEPSSGRSYPLAIFMAVRLETSLSGTRLLLARMLSTTVIWQRFSTSWAAELKLL